jgi:hypothetical protein
MAILEGDYRDGDRVRVDVGPDGALGFTRAATAPAPEAVGAGA